MTNNAEARAREVLAQQMEQQDENLPSSVARDQGLVWLSGWFDLSTVLQEYGNERAAQEREANAAIAERYPSTEYADIGIIRGIALAIRRGAK